MQVLGIGIAIFVLILIAKGVVIIKQAEVMIIERFGSYNRTLQSGLHIIWPVVDKARNINWRYTKTSYSGEDIIVQKTESRIDLREVVYDFSKQNVITSDNVSIEIDALIYFQITDPVKALYEIQNLPHAIEKLTQTTLRNVIGELELDNTLTSRDTVNTKLRDILDEATDKWGVKVNRVELKDINPPQEIKIAMEKQMRAERNRRAKILDADGEKQSQILVAEGDRDARITRAEGEAKSRLIVAEAEANAISKIAESVAETGTDPAQYLIALNYIKAFQEVTKDGDKTILIPYEATSMLSSVKAIEKIFKQ